ncbi:hypothetical protein [Fervidibacter sacchari]
MREEVKVAEVACCSEDCDCPCCEDCDKCDCDCPCCQSSEDE